MNIELWTNFSKKKNSTKQPTAGSGTTKSVYWKENTSIENPVLILSEPATQYCYCSAFGNYYFVDDVVNLDANRSELHCTMDALATNKTAIGSYTAFVERAASSYDDRINDPLLTAQQTQVAETRTNTSLAFFGSGCYIVEALNKDNGIELFAVSTLEPFKQIFVPSTYSSQSILDWIDSKIAQAFNLADYIGGVKWVPFDVTDIGTATNYFGVGPIDVGTQGYSIYTCSQSFVKRSSGVAISLPAAHFDDWRDANPRFSSYKMHLPGVGLVDLDASVIGSLILDNGTLHADIDCDLVSGEIQYRIYSAASIDYLATFNGNVAINVPIGKSVSDISKTFSTVVGGAGGVVAGAAVGGPVGAIAAAGMTVISAVDNVITPQVSVIGGNGNKASLMSTRGSINITSRNYGAKDYPTAVAGRPLYQNVQISSLSGYIKCGGASIASVAFGNEKSVIDAYLNNGFYYE